MIRAASIALVSVLAGGTATLLVMRRLRSISKQLIAVAVAASLLPTSAVLLAGLVMFKRHDLVVLTLLAVASTGTSALLAVLLAAKMGASVVDLHHAAARMAEGDLSVRVAETGPNELRELARSFNGMAGRLDRLFETRRNLVAWASHDLRAPLSSLQAMIEALEDGLADTQMYMPAMRSQVRMLSSLVDDLFELSRIETGTLALALTDIRIDDLAAECIRTARPEAERKGIQLELQDGSNDAVVRCDPAKVQRVLLNLLSNALRHTPHDGTVAVRVERKGPTVSVAVEDTGEGVPAAAMDRVFESFWRADPARNVATGGAGLGLAIARGFVEVHGGRIWAENRSGGGARFVFTLPSN